MRNDTATTRSRTSRRGVMWFIAVVAMALALAWPATTASHAVPLYGAHAAMAAAGVENEAVEAGATDEPSTTAEKEALAVTYVPLALQDNALLWAGVLMAVMLLTACIRYWMLRGRAERGTMKRAKAK
ncbi:hypothetical protein IDH44_16960 [Paenibacillus sp. IB182496]|uniref:Transmembrane protein n=1 Tax=Paenibacillus sabuli TaxID=2772509 RepID=A0A927BWP6_9BACL|nr:hypothetical protein [Paenibacillus sabuli]MBD2846889.1 hypothetical protein [Paenibacillus sabuli]